VASHVQDDGFHEIQLNGKQLVFLFMAATVVSVVIFLCGVLVGRGVRAERSAGEVASNSANEAMATTPQQPAAAPAPAPAAGSDPTTVAPPPAATDDLTYFNRLEKQKADKEEKLKTTPEPAPARPAPAAAAPPTPAPAPPPPVPAPTAGQTESAAVAQPSAQGYAVQVAALNVKSEADAIAKRLSSKGYTAYVLAPASGTPSVYRVRVGKFPTRREADSIAARLKKEEQFNPWVTR
jgi:cell division septation protein DedD